MPAWLAKLRDLPMPQKAVTGVIHRQIGLEIRAGLLRAKIVGLKGVESSFPCFFLGDPDDLPGADPGGAAGDIGQAAGGEVPGVWDTGGVRA